MNDEMTVVAALNGLAKRLTWCEERIAEIGSNGAFERKASQSAIAEVRTKLTREADALGLMVGVLSERIRKLEQVRGVATFDAPIACGTFGDARSRLPEGAERFGMEVELRGPIPGTKELTGEAVRREPVAGELSNPNRERILEGRIRALELEKGQVLAAFRSFAKWICQPGRSNPTNDPDGWVNKFIDFEKHK